MRKFAVLLLAGAILAPTSAVFAQDDLIEEPPVELLNDVVDKIANDETNSVIIRTGDLDKDYTVDVESVEELEELVKSTDGIAIEANEVFSPAGYDDNVESGSDTLRLSGYDGSNKIIAILDTGFDTSISGLSGKIVREVCISDGGYCGSTWLTGSATDYGASNAVTGTGAAINYASSCTGYSHGTTVASAAVGANTVGSSLGAATDASVLLIRVSPCGGNTTTYNLEQAMLYVNNNRNAFAGKTMVALNASFSTSTTSGTATHSTTCDSTATALTTQVNNLLANNVISVIAAGNSGSSTMGGSPGCISSALTVGGYNRSTGDAQFDWPTYVDTVANSNGVSAQTVGGSVIATGGTSLAAPQVAGLVAQLHEAQPGLSGTAIRDTFWSAGPTKRDCRPASCSGNTLRRAWGPDLLTKVGELANYSSTKYNLMKSTRVMESWGNFHGIAINPGTSITLNLAGHMGVAPANLGGVVGNLTLWGDGCDTIINVIPNGGGGGGASSSYSEGGINTSRVLINASSAGYIDLSIAGGCGGSAINWALDVQGYFGASADFVEMAPVRAVNGQVLGAGGTYTHTFQGAHGIPSNATGVVGSLLVYQSATDSFVDVGPADGTVGTTALSIQPASAIRGNLVWTKLSSTGTTGRATFWNYQGTATIYYDVVGYTLPGSTSVVMLDPNRTYDSRFDSPATPLSMANSPRNTALLGVGGVPGSGVKAVAANVLGIDASATPTYLNITGQGQTTDLVDVNLDAGVSRTNSAIVPATGSNVSARVIASGSATTNYLIEPMAYMPN